MPDSPVDAKFLKREDKFIAIERLRMNQMGIGSGMWKWDHVWEAMLDLKTWLWFSLMFIISSVPSLRPSPSLPLPPIIPYPPFSPFDQPIFLAWDAL